jgi:diguanylate cyclase (GGDEF)-like protein
MTTRQASAGQRQLPLFGGFALAAILQIVVVVAVALGIEDLIEDSRAVAQSHRVLETVRSAYAEIRDAESSQRGYLLTGREDFLIEFYAASPAVVRILGDLRAMVTEDHALRIKVDGLAQLSQERIRILDRVAATRTREGFDAALSELLRARGAELMDQIAQQAFEIETAERERLAQRYATGRQTAQELRLVAVAGIAMSMLVLLFVFGLLIFENRARRRAQRAEGEARERLESNLGALQRVSQELHLLSRYAGMLQSCRTVDEAVDLSRDAFAQLLPNLGGSIYLVRESQDYVQLRAQFGSPLVQSLNLMRPDDCWALRRGQTYALPVLQRGAKCDHLEMPAPGRRAGSLCIPLTAQGRNLGLVSISGEPEDERIPGEDLARAAAEQLSLCLFNLQLQESLRAQSIRDPLTGLFNRRYLEESLARELARCSRNGKPLAVAMCDIDHFKRFNDSYGHDGGDTLLKAFARLLLQGARREDIVCRFGGEEFTLILPETDQATALRRIEELRKAVSELRVVHLQQPLASITASFGLALMPENGESGDDLLRAADAALYRAKAGGRNRVVVAETG